MPTPILNPAAVSFTGFSVSAWNTVTAANSGAPVGASGLAYLLVTANASFVRETRTGPADSPTDNYVSDTMGQNQQTLRFCKLDGNGAFQYYTTNTTPTTDTLYPLMWFGAEAVWPVSIIAMPTMTNAFATYSTGGNAPLGIAAVFNIHGANDNAAYFRLPTSTDNWENGGNENAGRRDYMTMLDSSQNYAAKAGTTGRQPYLVMYMTTGFTGYSTAVDRTPGTAGSYQNLSTSGDSSPVAILYQMYNSSGTQVAYQLSGQGSTWTAPSQVPGGKFSANAIAYAAAQVNIATTAMAVKELGYFTQTIAAPYPGGGVFVIP